MTSFIRSLVSGSRNRYTNDNYNLDLTYITNQIVAMSVPSISFTASFYRNPLDKIADFLNTKHPNCYMIFNLSEMSYEHNEHLFGHAVQNCGWPDHHPPTLSLLFIILRSMHSWIKSDPKNLAVVHCKAGKSRTGLVICAYLLWIHEFSTVPAVLQFFLQKRGEGISSPSQIQYLRYFHSIINSVREPTLIRDRKLLLRSVFVHTGHSGALFRRNKLVIQVYATVQMEIGDVRHLLMYSSATENKAHTPRSESNDDILCFSLPNLELEGDMMVVGRLNSQSSSKKLFRFAFHTAFVDDGVLRIPKAEMDHAFKNRSLGEDFHVDLIFEFPPEDSNQKSPGITTPASGIWQSTESLRQVAEHSAEDASAVAAVQKKFNDRLVQEDKLLEHLYSISSQRGGRISGTRWIKCLLNPVKDESGEERIRLDLKPTLEAEFRESEEGQRLMSGGTKRGDQILASVR